MKKDNIFSSSETYPCQETNQLCDVYWKNGENASSVTIKCHKNNTYSELKKKTVRRTEEDRIEDMVAQRSRTIKDVRLSNSFEWCAVLSWRSEKRRKDTDYQNKSVRAFLKELKKKYPDIYYIAVRHKNENSEGYHVHLCIGGLPRRALRIRKGVSDESGRQTYCLLGWSKHGWNSAERIESNESFILYVGKRAKMRLLPKEIKSLVAYSRNLKRPERKSAVLNENEVRTFENSVRDKVVRKTKFVIDNGIYGVPVKHMILRGKPELTEGKGGGIE